MSVILFSTTLLGGMANMIISIIFQDTYGNTIGKYSMTVFSIMMTVILYFVPLIHAESSRPYQVLH